MLKLYLSESPNAYPSIPMGEIEVFTFPGGECHVRLPTLPVPNGPGHRWVISARLESSHDIMALMLVRDALDRSCPAAQVDLIMPYVPFARQDRVAVPGEAFSAEVFSRLINSLNFGRVTISDPHSPVVVQLLDRVEVLSVAELLPATLTAQGGADLIQSAVLVAPDKGAAPRVEALALSLADLRCGIRPAVVRAVKHRDPVSGRLSAPELLDPPHPSAPLLVVDDICDGGGTFIQLAREIRKVSPAPLHLYVTHGIFSKGLEPLLECYDSVFCPYPFSRHLGAFVPVPGLV